MIQVGKKMAMLGLALAAVSSGGCLAVGVTAAVGGAAVGYYALTNRYVRDYPADMERTLAAVRTSLADLRFSPAVEKREDGMVTLETKAGDGAKVIIEVKPASVNRIPVEAPTTRVGIHIGLINDEDSSCRIFSEMEKYLPRPLGQNDTQPVAGPPPQPVTVGPLRPVAQPTLGPIQPIAAETTAPPLAK